MNDDPMNMIHTSQQWKKKDWTKNLKDILDHTMQSIEVNTSEHQSFTLATTFHKPVVE